MRSTKYVWLWLALASVSVSCTLHSENAPGAADPALVAPAACLDQTKNGSESDIDCGGDGVCPACGDHKACRKASDCTSQNCANSLCQPSSCTDGVKNGTETDLDCGGPCPPCNNNQRCTLATDCSSRACSAGAGVCVAAGCLDGIKNGTESDIDCGGVGCPACGVQRGCQSLNDCTTAHCANKICLALPMCNQIHQAHPSVPSGIWVIDPGQHANDRAPFPAYCDMTTDGGGWTLALSYAHAGNTNPALVPGQVPLDPNAGFSHFSNTQLLQAVFSETRFYCQTNQHARIIHFKTAVPAAIAYLQGSGNNDPSYWNTGFLPLAGHTAKLPAAAASASIVPAAPMTEFPYFLGFTYHWGVRGGGSRWECDDFPNSSVATTLHQVWLR